MANQTELLNVSNEMKLDNDKQNLCEELSAGELCSSSLDTTEELYSSSATDAHRSRDMSTKGGYVEILDFTYFARVFKFSGQSNFGRKKEISHEIKVSVVMELV